ncbi:cold and drought-regulated protein CORA-like [Corylus avellana]|uniref:cold and drought-regulated protein CORA-like n=1 Tax=Corylus avellana TaxID=13451 RepID=UPI00286A4FFD|nr:cold and drought-regulated protein CORA-like [Corylus avellana]
MSSKAFLLLGLLLAIVLLISSEVGARELTKTSTDHKNVEATNGVDDAKYGGGYGGNPGGGYGGNRPGHGGYNGGNGHGGYNGGHGGYNGGNGHGGYNGGHGGYNGGHGGYGGGQGRCYYGCCREGYYGKGCSRCCSYAGEAADAKTEAKPQN